MVTLADKESIRGFKRGGIAKMCLPIPTETQNHIEHFQVNSKTGAMYFSGNVGLTRLEIKEGETVHQTVESGDSPISMLRQSNEWVATGSPLGSVVVREAKGLSKVGQIDAFRGRLLNMAVFDNSIAAAFTEKHGCSVVKLFDVRKLDKEVNTVSDIPSANILSLQKYKNPHASSVDTLLCLTPEQFHVLRVDQEKPVFSSPAFDVPTTCSSVSQSNTCLAIGNEKNSFSAWSGPTGKPEKEFVMCDGKQPPKPKSLIISPHWQGTAKVDSGYDYTADVDKLASNWPDDNYMVLSVPQKLRCVTTEKGSHPNQWDFQRYHSYITDPKDKLRNILPNPYPFNSMLGSDPSKVHGLLMELRKHLKLKRNKSIVGPTNDYSPCEDASLTCYSLQHRFDWKSCNVLPHKVIGIDNSFPECWMTSTLQSLYLCQPPHYPIRKILLRYLCSREFCLACEVSFVFANMLTTASSALGLQDAALPPIVQVGDLIRTMKQLRPFQMCEIFEPPKSRDDAVAKMHQMQRVLLSTLDRDLQDQLAYPFPDCHIPSEDYCSSIPALFGTQFTGRQMESQFFWDVPGSALKVDEGLQHLLKQLEQRFNGQVNIQSLPPIIVLLLNPEHNNLKPPPSLKISHHNSKADFEYVLNSNIIHLADDPDDVGNFVSHQRIKDDEFVLVNDYKVTSLPKPPERNIPATRPYSAVISFYALKHLAAPGYAQNDENKAPNMWHILGPLLINDIFAPPMRLYGPPKQIFKSPLKSYDEIKPGDLIAIDAEYVKLKWPLKDSESEFFYLSKGHMGLARVSCLLSQRDGDERTIMDDYVHIPEEIEDYVTQYSGIHPGDLDPATSTKCLTCLKATYLKLRALVDGGVTFVGHGLGQDFRVCNIAVPKKQIIDTLEIFHKPNARYLSLRFLAYHVLRENVQEDEHDSIEDARTSLRLYRKYEELKALGKFDEVLDLLMAKGAESGWQVPVAFQDTPISPSLMGSPVFKVDEDAMSEAAKRVSTPVPRAGEDN
ncbi:Ubiquitin carboxyl-terminal hydrolase/Exonuclease, putative [Angomonas deanei]|uniref:Ubiquitin carboxyl-terminal hydrolase/Exonuclease, putative n=1 Tax=Angomonas deanei TaxID=59799 RepID=A0A7G2CFZ1_9TRYP|nr:Ubiquitin carboxyl-terminal hydrolase/Exonuclease, putative [Angomonas deanei]